MSFPPTGRRWRLREVDATAEGMEAEMNAAEAAGFFYWDAWDYEGAGFSATPRCLIVSLHEPEPDEDAEEGEEEE